jgi:hypothetical protein
MTSFFEAWLYSEDSQRDSILLKKIYIDINGGHIHAGILFSQIMYWHGTNLETGKPRMTIQRDGHLWLAKRYSEWFDECRVNEHTAKAEINKMIGRGLLFNALYKFGGLPTVHIRVNPVEFEARVRAVRYVVSNGIDMSSLLGQLSHIQPFTEITAETTNTDPLPSDDGDPTPRLIKGDFTMKKYYPVYHERRLISMKAYSLKEVEQNREKWNQAGATPLLGGIINASPDLLTYKRQQPQSPRDAVFDAFAVCAWYMPENFNAAAINGKGGHIGKLITGFAELLGKTYNEIINDEVLAQKIRHAYQRWHDVKGIDATKDPATFYGWFCLVEQGTDEPTKTAGSDVTRGMQLK